MKHLFSFSSNIEQATTYLTWYHEGLEQYKSTATKKILHARTYHRGEKAKKRPKNCSKNLQTILSVWKKNNDNYKRSILEEEDQKPNINLRAKLQLWEVT